MSGRVALVTGAGRGIGREAALLLSAAGARVMIVSRNATELAAVGLEYVVADLGTAQGCALAVAETVKAAQSVRSASFAAIQNQEDAPPCLTCGSIMVRSGACYKCTNCGTTSGCA